MADKSSPTKDDGGGAKKADVTAPTKVVTKKIIVVKKIVPTTKKDESAAPEKTDQNTKPKSTEDCDKDAKETKKNNVNDAAAGDGNKDTSKKDNVTKDNVTKEASEVKEVSAPKTDSTPVKVSARIQSKQTARKSISEPSVRSQRKSIPEPSVSSPRKRGRSATIVEEVEPLSPRKRVKPAKFLDENEPAKKSDSAPELSSPRKRGRPSKQDSLAKATTPSKVAARESPRKRGRPRRDSPSASTPDKPKRDEKSLPAKKRGRPHKVSKGGKKAKASSSRIQKAKAILLKRGRKKGPVKRGRKPKPRIEEEAPEEKEDDNDEEDEEVLSPTPAVLEGLGLTSSDGQSKRKRRPPMRLADGTYLQTNDLGEKVGDAKVLEKSPMSGNLKIKLRTGGRRSYKKSSDISPDKAANPFLCGACDEAFPTIDAYQKHRETDHPGQDNRPFCPRCNTYFKTSHSLRLHTKNKHPLPMPTERGYKCEICGFGSTTSSNLRVHMRKHTGEKPYKCDQCERAFGHSNSLKGHKRVVHQGLDDAESDESSDEEEEKRDRTQKKPYGCNFCGKRFLLKGNLRAHKRTHTKETPYPCDYCGKTFAYSSSLKGHVRTYHSKTGGHVYKPFKCHTCGKLFSQSGNLKVHIRIHTGEKPYECEYCNEQFPYKSTVRLHKIKAHNVGYPSEGEKESHTCGVCQRTFTQKGNLNIHMRLHTGEKPYTCMVCSSSFRHLSSFKKHLAITGHSGDPSGKYNNLVFIPPPKHSCTVCHKEFSQKGNLNIHMRLHSGEKPYKCDLCPKQFAHRHGLKKHQESHQDRDQEQSDSDLESSSSEEEDDEEDDEDDEDEEEAKRRLVAESLSRISRPPPEHGYVMNPVDPQPTFPPPDSLMDDLATLAAASTTYRSILPKNLKPSHKPAIMSSAPKRTISVKTPSNRTQLVEIDSVPIATENVEIMVPESGQSGQIQTIYQIPADSIKVENQETVLVSGIPEGMQSTQETIEVETIPMEEGVNVITMPDGQIQVQQEEVQVHTSAMNQMTDAEVAVSYIPQATQGTYATTVDNETITFVQAADVGMASTEAAEATRVISAQDIQQIGDNFVIVHLPAGYEYITE